MSAPTKLIEWARKDFLIITIILAALLISLGAAYQIGSAQQACNTEWNKQLQANPCTKMCLAMPTSTNSTAADAFVNWRPT